MADDLIKAWGSWVILIVCLGSIVDLFQFVWILKRTFRKTKRAIYARIKREILQEERVQGGAADGGQDYRRENPVSGGKNSRGPFQGREKA